MQQEENSNLYNQTMSWSPSYNGTKRDLKISIIRVTPAYARELLSTM